MRPNLANGGRVVIYINGQRWGRAISLEYTSESQHRMIEGIDEIMPAELAITRVRVKGSIRCYRLVGDGGIEGVGITAPFADLPRQKYFSLALKDRFTDHTIFQCDYCVVDNQNWTVQAKELMMGAFSFSGITWGNETSSGIKVN